MDPNLFHLDWDRTLEAVVGIIIIAFIVERITALFVEARFFVYRTTIPAPGSVEALREKAALAAALSIIDSPDDEVIRIARSISPEDAVWPLDLTSAERTRASAREFIAHMSRLHDQRHQLSRAPLKETIALAFAVAVCLVWEFDALSIILLSKETTTLGMLLTAAVVAGGSKAAVKLLQDFFGIRSRAAREMRAPEKA